MFKNIPKPLQPNDYKYIFTEGIDYLKTGKRSIWGGEDSETSKFLRSAKLRGRWLHLAAGDGRYNNKLLRTVNTLTASDIDKSALAKLWHNTPLQYRRKLTIKPFNMVKRFPFKNNSFDGLFCMGVLHIFPKSIFRKISAEMKRVLKPGGMVVIDFATDVRRDRFDGKPYIIKGEPNYTLQQGKGLLKKVFRDYDIKMRTGYCPTEANPKANPPYFFTSKYIVMVATKK